MTPDEQREWEFQCEKNPWYQQFYQGIKYNAVIKRYLLIDRFSELWKDFLEYYEPVEGDAMWKKIEYNKRKLGLGIYDRNNR